MIADLDMPERAVSSRQRRALQSSRIAVRTFSRSVNTFGLSPGHCDCAMSFA